MSGEWRLTAAAQRNWITRGQLRDAGMSDERITAAVNRGDLVRVGRGLYRAGGTDGHPPLDSWLSDLWLAVLRAGPYSFAFRRSAAALWGLDGFDRPDRAHVEVGTRRGRHVRTGAAAYRTATLLQGDVVTVDGLRVTSPLRTLFDLSSLGEPDLLERALESAIRKHLVAEEEVRSRRHPAPACGAATWTSVLGRRPGACPATESDAETRFVQLCRRAGLPEPRRQHQAPETRGFRLDFAWPDVGLAVEVDGRRVHGPDALGADLRRQNKIVLAGWLILRFTFDDIVVYPDETVATLRRAFGLLAVQSA